MKTFMEEYGLIVVAAIVIMIFVVIGPVFGNGEADGIKAAYEKISLMGKPGPGVTMTDGKNLTWKDFKNPKNGEKYGYDASLITDAEIGINAFYNCSSIESIIIPEGVTAIGSRAFENCSSLKSITIPDSITSLGHEAFKNCTSLDNVVIPDGVEKLDRAFFGCSGLTSITIPQGVKEIAGWEFSGCSSLSSITIPSSVTSIGTSAFSGCSNLEKLTIPDSITSLSSYAFENCGNLKEFQYEGTKAQWKSMARVSNGTTIHCSDGDMIFKDNAYRDL